MYLNFTTENNRKLQDLCISIDHDILSYLQDHPAAGLHNTDQIQHILKP